jgi:hypothetical protein
MRGFFEDAPRDFNSAGVSSLVFAKRSVKIYRSVPPDEPKDILRPEGAISWISA